METHLVTFKGRLAASTNVKKQDPIIPLEISSG